MMTRRTNGTWTDPLVRQQRMERSGGIDSTFSWLCGRNRETVGIAEPNGGDAGWSYGATDKGIRYRWRDTEADKQFRVGSVSQIPLF
ncbi:hypothetical protein GN956_G7656 [Arapaima gigas]